MARRKLVVFYMVRCGGIFVDVQLKELEKETSRAAECMKQDMVSQ